MSVFSQQGSALTLPTAFQQHEPQSPPKKLLNVTFTILSMTGVHAKESCKKKRSSVRSKLTFGKFWQGDTDNETGDESTVGGVQVQPTTTVVASFERTEQKQQEQPQEDDPTSKEEENTQKKIVTHIPSLPLNLPPPPTSPSRNNKAKLFNGEAVWPEQNNGAHSKISSFTFSRYFPYETSNGDGNGSSSRYVPQICPIQISISRNGKMYKLGYAHVLVSGDENGEFSVDVPVVNFEQAFSSRINGSGGGCNLMRLKDDTLKCGLGERAMLRLLVRVSDPILPRIQVNYVLSTSTREIREQLRREEEESTKQGDKIQVGTTENSTGLVNGNKNGSESKSCKQVPVVLDSTHGTHGHPNDNMLSPSIENMLSSMASGKSAIDNALSAASTVSLKKNRTTASGSLSLYREASNSSTRFSSYRERSGFSRGTDYTGNYTDFTEGTFTDDEEDYTQDDNCSTDTESSSEQELLKLIRNITKTKVQQDAGHKHSSLRRRNDDSNSTVCSDSLATNSTDNSTRASGSDIINSPPLVKRVTNAFAADCGRITGTATPSINARSTSSLLTSWTRRMVCCASAVGDMNIDERTSAKDDESLHSLMSFDEKDKYYSLKGREHNQSMETDHTPW